MLVEESANPSLAKLTTALNAWLAEAGIDRDAEETEDVREEDTDIADGSVEIPSLRLKMRIDNPL